MNLEEQYKKETGEEARPGCQNYAGDHYHYDLYSIKYVKWLEAKANPVENRVSLAEPDQQLFTIEEVTDLLQEQKNNCWKYYDGLEYKHRENRVTIYLKRKSSIIEAPPPQKFIDKIIVKR